jgi:hypothetical protein
MSIVFSWLWSVFVLPTVLFLFVGFIALFTDLGNWLMFRMAHWAIDRAENFMVFLKDNGILPEASMATIPPEFGVLIGYLRIPEIVGILMTAYALSFVKHRFIK